MRIIFMLPITLIDIAAIIIFTIYYNKFSENNLTGSGFVALFFFTLYTAATISRFIGGIPKKSNTDLFKKGIIHLIFISIFTPVFFTSIFSAKPLNNFLEPLTGSGIASTLGGVYYAVILIFLSGLLWSMNNWISPEKK